MCLSDERVEPLNGKAEGQTALVSPCYVNQNAFVLFQHHHRPLSCLRFKRGERPMLRPGQAPCKMLHGSCGVVDQLRRVGRYLRLRPPQSQ